MKALIIGFVVVVLAAGQASAATTLTLTSSGTIVQDGQTTPNDLAGVFGPVGASLLGDDYSLSFSWTFNPTPYVHDPNTHTSQIDLGLGNGTLTVNGVTVSGSNQTGVLQTIGNLVEVFGFGGPWTDPGANISFGTFRVGATGPDVSEVAGNLLSGNYCGPETCFGFAGFSVPNGPFFTLNTGVGLRPTNLTIALSGDPLPPPIEIAPLPEPGTWGLLVMAMGAIGSVFRRRRVVARA